MKLIPMNYIYDSNLTKKKRGFSLIELLVVIAIIGILAGLVVVNMRKTRERAYYSKAKTELRSIHQSIEFYLIDYADYPPDADRGVPPGLEEYLVSGIWSDAAWPGSIFDWDNWVDPVTGERIYQISVRFCSVEEPDKCRFPNEDWAEDFDYYSAVYHCVSGPCRSHISRPIDHPGHCINCLD